MKKKKLAQAVDTLLASLVVVLALMLAMAAVVYISGGVSLRWLGRQGERAGIAVKEGTERAASRADELRQGMRQALTDVKKDLSGKNKGKK